MQKSPLQLLLSLSLVIFASVTATACTSQPKETIDTPLQPAPALEEQATLPETTLFTYECPEGTTAFDALVEAGENVEYDESSFGKLVTSINGTEQNSGKYWLYSINGQEASIGADSYTCAAGDTIEWELK